MGMNMWMSSKMKEPIVTAGGTDYDEDRNHELNKEKRNDESKDNAQDEKKEKTQDDNKEGAQDTKDVETEYIDLIAKAVASADATAVAHWLALEPPGRLGWEGREWYLQCACQEAAQAKERPIVQLLVDDMRARRST